MESFQQPHGYLRPPQPPPHPADPHHHQFHHPPRQPAPPQGSWFSNQFQYHPSQTPSPPQWAPPPPPLPPQSDHFPTASYPPPSNAYPPPHSYHHNQFPPPPPPPQFPPHSHIPQPYHQEWSTPSWPTNQGWDYSGHKNEEDWAARARAWADAKAAMESQHLQPQFAPAGRLQEQTHYHDQYQQSVDSCYADIQNQSHPSSSYQQIPVSDVSLQRVPGHSQEAVSINSDTSYISDGHLPYSARDGTAAGDSTVAYQHQGNLPTNPSVHQQEVSSSYSSVTGKENANQNQQSYTMLPSTSSSQGQLHHLPPPAPMQPHFASSTHSVDPTISLADQPLDFAPRFNRDNDLQMQPTFAHHDPASMNSWGTPVVPGVGYPPIPPVLASGPQHDPSISTHSPVPGQVAPPFGRFPGPGLSPPIPPAPFALSAGTTLNPTAAFSTDAYGISAVPERPKKASVPNWLREEIKKTVIAGPSADHHKDDPKFIDNDSDKSYVKGNEPDSKSIDSSKSAEEEEDDEDYVEAARTAAINQEIKRVLTEVLLKVTDELFDEIATKVLDEDDLTDEAGQNIVNSDYQTSASPPSGAIPKASAKILVPVKVKESENEAASEKSNSSSPGDVLGLGNYASDADDGDDEIESSSIPFPTKDAASQSGNKKVLEDMHTSSQLKLEEDGRRQTDLVNNLGKTNSVKSKASNGAATDQLHDHKANKEVDHVHVSKVVSEDRDHELNTREKRHDKSNGSGSKDTPVMMTSKQPGTITGAEKTMGDHPGRENRTKADKIDRREKSSEKDSLKEVQGSKARADEKDNDNHKRKDERRHKREKADDINEAKEGVKEHNVRPGEKLKESESRKRSSQSDGKDDRKESEKAYKGSSIDDARRRNERTKDKGEHRLRHKDAGNYDKHGRRCSPSVSSRGKSKRDHAANNASDSSDGSDGSKRKRHSRKHDLSPSPVRSRRRQVSRSPHSKHSQRRHSPYSSLDNTRGRRSRSRSPVRRQR